MPAGFHVASAWVDIHAEDAGLRAEIQNAIRAAAAGDGAKVKLNLDASDLRGKVDAALAGATSGNRGKIKLDLDAGDLRGKIDAALSGATAGNRAKIKIDLDAADLRGKIDAALAGAGAGQKVKVGVDLDTNALRGKISAMVAEAGAGQRVRVGVDIDRNTLSRAGGALDDYSRSSSRAGRAQGLLSQETGIFGLKLKSLLGIASLAEPVLGAMLGPLQTLGVASAVLAPALLGVATAGAALVIGTKGVGTAMKAGQKDSVSYGAALNKLSPSAQDFVRATSGIGGAFSSMKLPVQQALFAGLGQQMTKLGQTALPVVTAGLTGMAGIMNTSFKGVADTLTKLSSGAGGGVLGQMFGGLQTAFKPLQNIPGQMTDMLVKLSAAATPLLTQITKGIGNSMSGLTKSLDQGFASGALQASITKAGNAVGTFFKNFKNNGAVQDFVSNLKTQGPAAAQSLQKIGEGALRLVNSSSGIGTALLKVGGAAAGIVNAIPSSVLSTILLTSSAFSLIGKAAPALTKVGAALRTMGGAIGIGGGAAAINGQALAMTSLGAASTRTGAALGGGALSFAAFQRRAAAMTAGSIAAQQMGGRMSSAGTVISTFGAGAASTASKMNALKAGAIGIGVAFAGMKGTDAVMGKIFGGAPNVSKMSKDLINFAATGKLGGEASRVLGQNFSKFGEAADKVAHSNFGDKIQNGLNRAFAWTGGDAFKDKNRQVVDSADKALASLVKMGKGDVANTLFNNLAKSAEKSGTSIGKLKSQFNDFTKAQKDQATAEKVAAAAMGTFGTEAIKTQKAIGANSNEVQGLQGSYNALGRFNAAATGAQLEYNQAVSGADSLIKKHTNSLSMQNGVLNTTKPKAQAAAGAMLQIAEAAKKTGEAFTGKGDFAQVAKTYQGARKEIEALGRAQGLTAAQAKEFTNQVLPIDTAKLYAKDIQQTAASIKTLNTAMSQGKAGQKLFNFDPGTFASTARAALTAVGAQVKTLSNGKMQVKVDTAQAKQQVGDLSKVFTALSKGTKEVKIPTADIGKVGAALEKAGMQVTKMKDGKIKITAEDGASTVIAGIQAKVNALKGVKIQAPNISGADTSIGKSLAQSAKGAKTLNDTMVKSPGIIGAVTPKAQALADTMTKTHAPVKTLADTFAQAGGASTKADAEFKKMQDTLSKPWLAHGKGPEGFGTALSGAATKAKPLTDAMSKLTASGKNIAIAVSISGTEQIGKLTALNAVKNKNIQVSVNISGTEQIGKLTALNAVKNKNIQVSVNISGTEQIGKLTALNAVKNKIVQVSVNISGTEQISKLTALNKVNNKTIQVSVAISGTEQINKLTALNKVNNKNIQVSVAISGTEKIDKLKALNQVNNKSITVTVAISGTEKIDKLKALNQVSNKSISVSVNISGQIDKIDKLKQLNSVANKSISVSVNVSGADQIAKLSQIKSLPASKHVTVTITANAGPINQIKSAMASIANKHVTVSVTANAGPINQIKSAIQSIANKTVTVTVSANAGPINSLKSAIAGITSKSVTVTATANAGPVNSLKAAISSVTGKSVTVTAQVNGLGEVQALISAIAAVQSKTVTVTVNTVKTGSAATGGHMTSASLAPGFASGGSNLRSYRSAGPVVGPGTPTSDSILARISNGEFIIRASMVKKYGPEFLAGINNGAYNPVSLMKKWGWNVPGMSKIRGFSSGGSSEDDTTEPNSHVSDNNNTGINYPPYVPGTGAGGNVGLSSLYRGAHNSAVLLVQKALHDIYPDFDYSSGPGTFGPQTQKYYSKFQKSLGFQGSDANGIPGIQSLTALQNRTGEFQIKSAAATVKYIIKWGDTLTSIARKFGTSVDELVKLNHISNPDRIYAGNSLKIPGQGGIGGVPPAVIPGTKPGDWNYLAPPEFSKLARKQSGSDDSKKDVGEVDTQTNLTGTSTYAQGRFFSNIDGSNPDELKTKIADATDTKTLAGVLDDMRTNTYKAFESGSGRDAVNSYLAQGGKIELTYEKNLQDVNKALETAKTTQDDLNSSYKSLNEQIQNSVQEFASIVKTGKAGASPETMIRQLTTDAGKATEFKQGLASLQGRGLNTESLAQIANAGPVDGLRTIKGLLSSTPQQIAQINALQAQVSTAASQAGKLASDAMYGAGMQAANGLVQGLTANQAAIQDAMKKIALAMELALKQALGIASPSKVMHDNGVWTIKGLIAGLQAEGKNVPDVIRAIAAQVQNGSVISATAATTAATAGATAANAGGGNIHIGELHVSISGVGMTISSPDDADKFAKALAPAMVKAIREETRKRS